MGCSLPLVTHIPNPVAGYMNLGGMKPLNMRERTEQIRLARIDDEERRNLCNFNALGNGNLFGCVDYRYGTGTMNMLYEKRLSETSSGILFETDGVRIKNNASGGNNEYMKYDLSPVIAPRVHKSIGDKFTIEMSVRGEALKRKIGDYYLFNTILGANNEVYLELNNGDLKLWNWTWFLQPKVVILSSDINSIALEDNLFYKILITFNWANWTLEIPEKNLSRTWSWISNIWVQYFIWSLKDNRTYEWNDVIGYIRIFKK